MRRDLNRALSESNRANRVWGQAPKGGFGDRPRWRRYLGDAVRVLPAAGYPFVEVGLLGADGGVVAVTWKYEVVVA